uniref:C-C motif chemokine n=1 Tax=Moschus moschiferus TaxID=68415 RepID=A0A8C6CQB2_MOSMO
MASLQTPLLAALILLAMILQATEAGPYGANVEDSICCRDYIHYPLPLRLVKYYYWTSNSCRRPGVVLLTMKDREICADPKQHWVKKILQKLSQ